MERFLIDGVTLVETREEHFARQLPRQEFAADDRAVPAAALHEHRVELALEIFIQLREQRGERAAVGLLLGNKGVIGRAILLLAGDLISDDLVQLTGKAGLNLVRRTARGLGD